MGKGKVVRRVGGGFEGVTTPAPPPENFNHTPFIRKFFAHKVRNQNYGKSFEFHVYEIITRNSFPRDAPEVDFIIKCRGEGGEGEV